MERERRRGKERGNAVCVRERERDNMDNKSDPALQIERDGFEQETYKEKYKVMKNEYEIEKEGVLWRESHTLAVLCRLDARRRRKIGYPT